VCLFKLENQKKVLVVDIHQRTKHQHSRIGYQSMFNLGIYPKSEKDEEREKKENNNETGCLTKVEEEIIFQKKKRI
jgi:hypothetical protein